VSAAIVWRIFAAGWPGGYSCPAGWSALDALERAGLEDMPVGCRRGGCGRCKARVVSGTYRTGKMSRAQVTAEEQESGLVLACRIYPLSDLHLTFAEPGTDNCSNN